VKSGKRNAIFNVSPTCLPNGQGSARCSAFRRTDSAFEPSLYQRRSPPSGNAIFQGRDKDPETAPAIQWADCRDKMRARTAASSGLFALNREISVCVRLRGGAERTRTACQPRSRYRTDLRPVANRLVCNPALESQHFGSYRRTIGTSNPADGDIGNHTFVEPDFLDLAWPSGGFSGIKCR
jgi:hypothetical protein